MVVTMKKVRPKTASPTRHGPQQCQVSEGDTAQTCFFHPLSSITPTLEWPVTKDDDGNSGGGCSCVVNESPIKHQTAEGKICIKERVEEEEENRESLGLLLAGGRW